MDRNEMLARHIMQKVAQQEVIPRDRPLPDGDETVVPETKYKVKKGGTGKEILMKTLGDVMSKMASAAPAAPAPVAAPVAEDPFKRMVGYLPTGMKQLKSRPMDPETVSGLVDKIPAGIAESNPGVVNFLDWAGRRAAPFIPVPDAEATGNAVKDTMHKDIESMGVIKGYKATRDIQGRAEEAMKYPVDSEQYRQMAVAAGVDPNNKIQYMAYQKALPEMAKAHATYKTEAWNKLKGWIGNNWQYIVPAVVGAGVLGWGLSGDDEEGYGARRPSWYENAPWRSR